MEEIKTIVIERLSRSDTNKEGKPYTTKAGKPFQRVSVMENENWYTAFDFGDWTKDWKEGDEIKVKVKENEYQGRTYLNIEKLSDLDLLTLRVETLEEELEDMKAYLKLGGGAKEMKEEAEEEADDSPDDIDMDDLPFD